MMFENRNKKLVWSLSLFISSFFFIFPSVLGETVVINSQDWKDVYYGILYAHYNNYYVFFANSPNPAGLFNILPKDKIILLESSNPFIPNLEAQLRVKGYVIEKKITLTNSYKQLMPEDIKDFYVVEEDFPWLSIPTGALARASNAWVLIVNENNVNDIVSMVSGANSVIAVGRFKRSIEDALSPYFTQKVQADSKFQISTELGRKFFEKKKVSQILITEGRFLEAELLKGHAPVLLVGTNLLPREVINFIKENDINTVIAIGPQLTYVGERIREETDKKVSVLIKFGLSTPGISPQIYAPQFFALPKTELKLSILQVIYDTQNKKLMIQFSNQGNTGLFEFTTFRVLKDGKEIASGGDEESVFIGAKETIWRSYDIVITDLTGNLTVEFYTSYGEDPNNLDTYLTEGGGKFAPPLVLPLRLSNIQDKSKIQVLDVKYYKDAKRFGVKIKNIGNVKAVVIVKLLNVKIKGIETSLSSEPVTLNPGETKEVFIPAELDEIDMQENIKVKLEVDYGEREDVIVNTAVLTLEVEFVSGSIMFYTGATVAIIAVIIALIKFKKRNSYGHSSTRYHYKPRR